LLAKILHGFFSFQNSRRRKWYFARTARRMRKERGLEGQERLAGHLEIIPR